MNRTPLLVAAGRRGRLRHGGAGERERGQKDELGSGHGNDCGMSRQEEQHAKVVGGGLWKFFGARSSVG